MGGKRFTIRPSTSELHCYVTIGSLYVEQLYTDAALVLDASTRVAAASRSGAIVIVLIDLHFMHKHSRLLIAILGTRLIVIREDQVHLQTAQVQCVTF